MYKGRKPSSSEIECISNVLESARVGELQVKVFTESSIAKLLAETSVEPSLHTEDGDAAVAYIAGIVKKMDIPELSIAIIRNFNKTGDTWEAFRRAIATIASGSAVSREIASKYGFTKDVRDVITDLYNAWKGNE